MQTLTYSCQITGIGQGLDGITRITCVVPAQSGNNNMTPCLSGQYTFDTTDQPTIAKLKLGDIWTIAMSKP